MPPARFGGGPPPSMSPYPHQFNNHQSHQPPSLATQGYLGNSQMSPFSPANGLAGLGAGFGDQTGLASHAARMGFAHGAQLQQQQQQHPHQQSHGLGGEHTARSAGQNKGRIRDVWKHNLNEEIAILRELIDEYSFVAMDTEFPGIVGRPMGNFLDKSDYHYQTLRVNVDMLKIIQVGIAIFNDKGETPPARPSADSADVSPTVRKYLATHGSLPYAWQFNFHFDIKEDMANQSSIESLQQAGIDFEKLERDGIDPNAFAALMTTSGLVSFEEVKWLSFHGGYDFGYFTKCLMDEELPNDGTRFDSLMKIWFPTTYDVKHLLKYAIKLHSNGRLPSTDPSVPEILQKFEIKSGLEAAAETFKIKRVGAAHQAGSDSLLTGKIFFSLREKIFNGTIPDDQIGKTWGLSVGVSMPGMVMYGAYNPPAFATDNKENTPTNETGANGNGPSTPSTASVSLAMTPAAAQSHNTNGNGNGNGNNFAPMTPGGGGGVLGSFFQGRN
ncbi:ribonuclease H-like domain-containing protein [Pseudomassariella vexata]|uniref:poly(A)-specific ribonuclease n=1 Tax=Pseudomassariella vexata TaxID=1141098 RepID=A0A1Y2EFJ2_9PEZI|nr:ribonuclease H-like domain-containing protein [Pseudomassariella vexata]ORY70074.1 ribonuclease H-like domain-containing protein [Pseudomassariella vexata]